MLTSCVDREEYREGDTVTWTIRSSRGDVVFLDACSIELARDLGTFEEGYHPQLLCGSDVDLAEIVAGMIPLGPGESLSGEYRLGGVVLQGRYRMNLWVLDAEGQRISAGPYFTPVFAIFPSR